MVTLLFNRGCTSIIFPPTNTCATLGHRFITNKTLTGNRGLERPENHISITHFLSSEQLRPVFLARLNLK